MIDGVIVTPLRRIPDERGTVMHMLRADAPHFEQFGEVYFSTAYPQAIKGWHYHIEQAQNYCVVAGMIKLVLYDDREGSPTQFETQELFIGDENYVLVHIPPQVWNGWKNIGVAPCLLANCATLPFREGEMIRHAPDAAFAGGFIYDWERKNG